MTGTAHYTYSDGRRALKAALPGSNDFYWVSLPGPEVVHAASMQRAADALSSRDWQALLGLRDTYIKQERQSARVPESQQRLMDWQPDVQVSRQ